MGSGWGWGFPWDHMHAWLLPFPVRPLYSLTGFSWEHIPKKSLAWESSSRILFLGLPSPLTCYATRPQAGKLSPVGQIWPSTVSKVLLESSHTYSFVYYLWLLYGRMAELSSFDMHCLSCKATDIYYLVCWQNKSDDCCAGQCFEHITLCLRDFACAVPSAWSSHSLIQWMINCFSVAGLSKKISSSETSSLPTHLRQTSASLVHCPVFSELTALTWWPLFIGCCSFHHYQLARELMRGRNLSVLLISGSQYALKNICRLRDEDEWKILQWACTHTNCL